MDEIEKKRAEIERYKGVLERYVAGRWFNAGKRHLELLETELKELEADKT